MPPFVDLHSLEEDKRIEMIGHQVMVHKKDVAFMTDADEGKAARYIAKLKARFPGIVILGQWPGPVANVVTVKVGPPQVGNN